MEQKINIAELLKDCPRGMELDCLMYDNVTLMKVDDDKDAIFPIKVFRSDKCIIDFTKYGQYSNMNDAKCVIFPKGKTTWEGFHRPFKDGDVVVTTLDNIAIISNKIDNKSYHTYCGLFGFDDFGVNVNVCPERLAIEEEKQKLFQAIKDNGYKWNAETKTLEKLIEPKFKVGDIVQDEDGYKVKIIEVNAEDECYEYESIVAKGIGGIAFSVQDDWELVPNKFDITTLVPFESRVLARNSDSGFWKPAFWGIYEAEKTNEHQYRNYLTTEGFVRHCIPYNDETKHLLGTTNDCDEFYKTWE